jgi:hypothetical protein
MDQKIRDWRRKHVKLLLANQERTSGRICSKEMSKENLPEFVILQVIVNVMPSTIRAVARVDGKESHILKCMGSRGPTRHLD